MLFALIIISQFFTYADNSRFSADNYLRKTKENKLILKGNVNIQKKDSELKADYVEVNTKTKNYHAIGNVDYKDNRFKVTAVDVKGNLKKPKLEIKKGEIKTKSETIQGEKIKRKNKDEFLIEQGRITSCLNDPADWRVYGKDIDVKLEEYAHINNVIFEMFGVPLFYLPYMILPVKYERQSGLLPPTIGFGEDGFRYIQPLFIAANRSNDMTVEIGDYSKRGLMQSFEFRNVLSKDSKNTLYFFHIKDKNFSKLKDENNIPLNTKHRTGLKIEQIFKLSEKTYMKNKIQYITDDNIPRDFAGDIEGREDPALETKVLFSTNTKNTSNYLKLSYYENLLDIDPTESNESQLHKLPEIKTRLAKTKLGFAFFEGDLSYLKIHRGIFYDDLNSNNKYDSGQDYLRAGHRIDFNPKVSTPINTKFLRIIPEFGLRYNYYMLKEEKNPNRILTEFKLDTRTEISKKYTNGNTKIKHIIEPFVEYKINPNYKRDDNPFFDTIYNNKTTPMFDSIDSLEKVHLVKYGLSNRIITKTTSKIEIKKPVCTSCSINNKFIETRRKREKKEGKEEQTKTITSEYIKQPFEWDIYQTYNVKSETKALSDLYSNMWVRYSFFNLRFFSFYNFYTHKFGFNNSIYLRGENKFLNLGFYYDKTSEDENRKINQIRLSTGFKLWRIGASGGFILDNTLTGSFKEKLGDQFVQLNYIPKSSCWMLKLIASAPYDRGFSVTINFSLLMNQNNPWF
jgi:lipopolysaccharide assembly outer membrane protein LptD (OstA)